jgi:hypothetical protein
MDLAKNFDTTQKLLQLHSENPNSMKKLFQLNTMYQFATAKNQNPKLNQSQLAKMIGSSKSTINRTRLDLGMNSLYRHELPLKTKKTVELTKDEIHTLKDSNLSPEEEERLNRYINKKSLKEIETQRKEENHKVTMRDLKTKADSILVSHNINQPTASSKKIERKSKIIKAAGDPQNIDNAEIDQLLANAGGTFS